MKKIFVILVALIGFGVSANAQSSCSSHKIEKVGPYRVINFTNNCDKSVKFTYEYWNGSKWLSVDVNVGAKDTHKNAPAGENPPAGTTTPRNITVKYD